MSVTSVYRRFAQIAAPALLALAIGVSAAASERLAITLRGKPLTLELYRPAQLVPRGTVFMGSGDVGWVGLGVDLAEFLQKQGYFVVGINVRQYLSAYTSGAAHVSTAEVPADYAAIAALLRDRHLWWDPVIVAGVSEGAALAVLAGSSAANHTWIKGVITMGLPPSAELAWRWTDVASWITKKDPNEPSFEPKGFLAGIAPIPLWMIQSTKDEYVTPADYRAFEAAALAPKRLVLISASNHRFTDKLPDLRAQCLAGLAWIEKPE
jgi:type IV secretory pathway VirJ component